MLDAPPVQTRHACPSLHGALRLTAGVQTVTGVGCSQALDDRTPCWPAPRRPRWPTAANHGPEEARKCSAATPTGLQQRPHPQARAALSSRMGLGQGLPERQHRQTGGQHPTHGLSGTAAPSTRHLQAGCPSVTDGPVSSCRNTGGQISLCLFHSVFEVVINGLPDVSPSAF